jgi:hypothetical protein
MTKETVGKVAVDLMSKQPDTTSPVEQMQEQLSEYDQNIWECVATHKKIFDTDFYVVVITKNEKLLSNTFRCYFFGRLSCPTPDWDQTVYKYKRKDNQLVFMWVIPSKPACEHLLINKHLVVASEKKLLEFVIRFYDGTLEMFAKELNGEKADSSELEDFTFKG